MIYFLFQFTYSYISFSILPLTQLSKHLYTYHLISAHKQMEKLNTE